MRQTCFPLLGLSASFATVTSFHGNDYFRSELSCSRYLLAVRRRRPQVCHHFTSFHEYSSTTLNLGSFWRLAPVLIWVFFEDWLPFYVWFWKGHFAAMSKTAYHEVTYNLAHPGGACLTSEASGTFLLSDFTPTRQGGHAVTVELIGARVLVYFDGANCRISGGVLKRGCFPKGEDEKDSWGSYEGGPTSHQQFLFSELLFHPFCGYRFGRWQQSHLRIIENFWLLVRFIRAEDSSEIAVSVAFRFDLKMWITHSIYHSLTNLATSGWKISLANLADTFAEQIYCWQISLTKLADVLLTNLSHQSRWYSSLQISEGKEKESDSVSTDNSRSKDAPVRRGKREYGWNHTWPETSRQKNKGWACKERKTGVWMEPYLAWSLATEWQWMSLNGSSRTRLDYPVSAITSSVERN